MTCWANGANVDKLWAFSTLTKAFIKEANLQLEVLSIRKLRLIAR